jgi:methylaspartate ammonia-lyase
MFLSEKIRFVYVEVAKMNEEKKNIVLTDACSPNMIREFPTRIIIDELDKDLFCQKVLIYSQSGDLQNALGRKSSAQIVNILCGSQFSRNKTRILLNDGGRLLVVLPMVRLNDDKELSVDEVKRLYKDGKIRFFEVFS